MDERDPYIAIMVAAAKGAGLHLTAQEVADLSMDDAIERHAMNCLQDDEWLTETNHRAWSEIKPRRNRKAANRAA